MFMIYWFAHISKLKFQDEASDRLGASWDSWDSWSGLGLLGLLERKFISSDPSRRFGLPSLPSKHFERPLTQIPPSKPSKQATTPRQASRPPNRPLIPPRQTPGRPDKPPQAAQIGAQAAKHDPTTAPRRPQNRQKPMVFIRFLHIGALGSFLSSSSSYHIHLRAQNDPRRPKTAPRPPNTA